MDQLRASRLAREWREVERCPVSNISVAPLNDGENINEWHGNIRGAEGSEFEGIVVHFIIRFPSAYPLHPPRIQLLSFIPHLNVQLRHGCWEVCLDMFELSHPGALTTPYQYWSSAFSVRSILIQMTSFLLAEGQPTHIASGNISRTRIESNEFQCSSCSHTFSNPNPRLPSISDVLQAPLSFPCVEVSGESAEKLQAKILQRRIKLHKEIVEYDKLHENKQYYGHFEEEKGRESLETKTIRKGEEESKESSNSPVLSLHSSSISISSSSLIPKSQPKPKVIEEEVWHVVKGKKSIPNQNQNIMMMKTKMIKMSDTMNVTDVNQIQIMNSISNGMTFQAQSQSNLFSSLEEDKILEKFVCDSCHKKLRHSSFSRSQLSKGDKRKCHQCLQTSMESKLLSSSNANAKKVDQNFLRREKKRLAKLAQQNQSQSQCIELNGNVKRDDQNGSSISKNVSSRLNSAQDILEEVKQEDQTVDIYNKEENEENEDKGEWKNIWRSCSTTCESTNKNMGFFSTLSRDTCLILFSYLGLSDIISMGVLCRGTASLCEDWLVWKRLFVRHYPRSALTPTGPNSSWKRAFMLEANGLSQDLICFTSFATKSESILGFPITYTTNPKTGCLDYATSTFDILSYDMFVKGGVRKTIWGEKFTDFLPIYIDQDHFNRGFSQLVRVSRKLVQEGLLNMSLSRSHHYQHQQHTQNRFNKHGKDHRGMNETLVGGAWMPRNDPEFILSLLTKMMNTQVVLLCDKGITASEMALTGYCQLHRLLLGVVDKFPELNNLIRQRLDDFIRKPETRVKSSTPSLGELLAMLSVSDTYSWKQISLCYLKESFDRSVLWACSKDPSLATVNPGDESRLSKYLEIQRVSLRLTLFHAVFLNLLVQGGGSKMKLEDCADRYDTFQGRPPSYLRREWQESVKSILEFSSWPQFFSISGVILPSKQYLLATLEEAVKNSLKKGYHSRDTVFQNVMKSGVSRILLKGETYSAAPNIKHIRMIEKWRFDGATIFLDASCLIYNFSGEKIGIVDYCRTSWVSESYDQSRHLGDFYYLENAPIQHSGDVVDANEGIGQHTIDINIKALPNNVAALYFTVSAWTTTLREISQPSAHLFDADSDSEMCRYKLEDQNTRDNTCVIMCKLHRKEVGGRWELTSIGHVGKGRAGCYGPIMKDIEKLSSH